MKGSHASRCLERMVQIVFVANLIVPRNCFNHFRQLRCKASQQRFQQHISSAEAARELSSAYAVVSGSQGCDLNGRGNASLLDASSPPPLLSQDKKRNILLGIGVRPEAETGGLTKPEITSAHTQRPYETPSATRRGCAALPGGVASTLGYPPTSLGRNLDRIRHHREN